MHNDNTLHREENEHTPKKESSKTKRPSFSYASFFGETGKYDEEESNDNDKQKELAGTLEENVDVSKINDTHENIRAEALENRLKRFLSIILAVLPTGAISLPIETLSGKTIDGNPLKGHDRLIYSVLAFLKIANVVLLHVLPSILEYDQADGRAKQGLAQITGLIRQMLFYSHKLFLNADVVRDYLNKKGAKKGKTMLTKENFPDPKKEIHSIKERLSEYVRILRSVYQWFTEENIDKKKVDRILLSVNYLYGNKEYGSIR